MSETKENGGCEFQGQCEQDKDGPRAECKRCGIKTYCIDSLCYACSPKGKIIMMGDNEVETRNYWWCTSCHREVSGTDVTYDELHSTCGHMVIGLSSGEKFPDEIIDELKSTISSRDIEISELARDRKDLLRGNEVLIKQLEDSELKQGEIIRAATAHTQKQ